MQDGTDQCPVKPPTWFNREEDSLFVSTKPEDRVKGDLILVSGDTKCVFINRVRRAKTPWYTLDWHWGRPAGFYNSHVAGRIELDAAELAAAFGLSDSFTDKESAWLLEEYSCTTAMAGKFIRSGPFLNIPGPGTGKSLDANISIFISKEIENAARKMLGQHTREART